MTLVLPQAQDSPAFDGQALLDATDLAAAVAAGQGTGIVSGGLVTPHNSGVDLMVAVTAGTALINGASVPFSAVASLDPGVASTNDRRDVVVVNSAGTVSFIAGFPCTVVGWSHTSGVLGPVKPSVPAGSALIYEEYIPGGATSITAANLIEKRAVPIAPPNQTYSTTFGDGAATSYTITHGLGTKDVNVFVYQVASPFQQVFPDIYNTSATTVTISGFATAPASNSLRAVVVASGGPTGAASALAASAGSTVLAFGHSFLTGGGAGNIDRQFITTLSGMLRTDLKDRAVGGSQIADDEMSLGFSGHGGWAWVLQSVHPSTFGAPRTPAGNLPLLCYGINDIYSHKADATGNPRTIFKTSLRTIMSRLCAAQIFEETDTTIVYTGAGWPAATANEYRVCSGSGFRGLSTTNADKFTITLPSDFEGGTVAVGFTVSPGSTGTVTWTGTAAAVSSGGAQFGLVTNLAGLAYAANGATGTGTRNSLNGHVVRFTGLTAADASKTLIGTVSGVNASPGVVATATALDYWQAEAIGPVERGIVLGVPYPSAANLTSNGCSTTDIDNYNTDMQAVIAEFNALSSNQWLFVDLRPVVSSSMLYTDGLHPNNKGHNAITAAVYSAIEPWVAANFTTNDIASQSRVMRRVTSRNFVILQTNNPATLYAGQGVAPVDYTLSSTTWAAVDTVRLTQQIDAQPGDDIEVLLQAWFKGAAGGGAQILIDVCTLDASNNVISYFSATDFNSPSNTQFGSGGLTPVYSATTPSNILTNTVQTLNGAAKYTVQPRDIISVGVINGYISLQLRYIKSSGTAPIMYGGGTAFSPVLTFEIKNLGQRNTGANGS